MFKILVCEESLSYSLPVLCSTYKIDIATTYDEIIDFTFNENYDLYVINFYFYAALEELKKSGDSTRIIFVDDYYNIFNLKKAFLIADDYMIKPLNLEEVKIRVEYHYQKLYKASKSIITYRDFFFHVNSKQLYCNSQKIKLSPNELKLVELFLLNVDKPIIKESIFEALESYSDGSLRVYISKLNKIGLDIVYERSISSYTLSSD